MCFTKEAAMARKTTFTAQDVESAAMALLEAEGVKAVTARRVADAMGASTAPVYSNYASMEELLAVLLGRASERIVAYCRRPWTEDQFLNMGVGFVRFAIEHPQLFRALYLDSGAAHAQDDEHIFEALRRDLDGHPGLGELPADHKDELLFQASIYTLGIATTVVTGMWDDPELEVVERWLRSVGGALTRAAMESAGMPIPPELERELGEFVVPWRHPGCSSRKDTDHD
jgi:AcrR family transcriptional regulator